MSIIDLMKDSSSESNMNGQVAMKLETNKIKRRIDGFIDEILDYINSETSFINRNLTYTSMPTTILTGEQKRILLKEIENKVKELPGKLDKELKEIYGSPDSKEEEKNDEPAKVDAVITKTEAQIPATANYFGY